MVYNETHKLVAVVNKNLEIGNKRKDEFYRFY